MQSSKETQAWQPLVRSLPHPTQTSQGMISAQRQYMRRLQISNRGVAIMGSMVEGPTLARRSGQETQLRGLIRLGLAEALNIAGKRRYRVLLTPGGSYCSVWNTREPFGLTIDEDGS